MSRRLTGRALKWLRNNISVKRYEDESTDWPTILDDTFGDGEWYEEGVVGRYIFDDTHKDAFEAADPQRYKEANHVDADIAIPFYENAGWGVKEVFDTRYLAYVTHVHMHRFNVHRWRFGKTKSEKKAKQIGLHWFTGLGDGPPSGPAVHKSNSAGRLWWLAHISEEATKFQQRKQILTKFCHKVDLYHETMSRSCFHNPELMAAFMTECPEPTYITKAGIQKLCKMSNQEATGRILDALSYKELRRILNGHVRYVMSKQTHVSARGHMVGPKIMRVLSLGAGVQSTVMALMADRGELYDGQRPDFAIFADTKWESPEVYKHLEWLRNNLSYDVEIVDAGDLRRNIMNGQDVTGHNHLEIPVFMTDKNGKVAGMGRRECTSSYKVEPIQQRLRRKIGVKWGEQVPWNIQVEMWLCISTDEMLRVKPSQKQWITNKWPLIDMKMSRRDCRRWFDEYYPDQPLPRSACIGCPYRNDAEWHDMKTNRPEQFRDAVQVDEALRRNSAKVGLRNIPYLHNSRKPLADVIFDTGVAEDGAFSDASECEGMCGV